MICRECKQQKPMYPLFICKECTRKREPSLRDFWTKPVDQQMRLSCQYGEPPEPLTDEEKDEMEGCGA